MSDTFPDLVYPARTVYHSVYGSHDATTPERAKQPWKYWVSCDGGPKRQGWPLSIPKHGLATVAEAELHGLRPCQRPACAYGLASLARRTGQEVPKEAENE